MRFQTGVLVLIGGLVLACGKDRAAAGADSTAGTSAAAPATPTYTYTDPRGAIFAHKGCPQCHTISGLGIKSPAEIGPDLTLADEDVVNRFGMPLQVFLHHPTGTMQMVLSSQITLDSLERDSIIAILKAINHERHEAEEKH